MTIIGKNPIEYLGDGLYVKFDGYQFELMANSPTEPTDVVYLDFQTYNSFVKFAARMFEQLTDKGE